MAATSRSGIVGVVGRFLPHGWRDFFVQLAAFWVFYAFYEGSRGLVDGDEGIARANALDVVHAERVLGIYHEEAVQDWTLRVGSPFLDVANWTYFNCQFTISYGLLFFLYLRRNHLFYFARNCLLLASFVGIVGYITLPTAPPRMFADLGFVDTLNETAVNHDTGIIATFANPYAAMPSLHTAYAVTIGALGIAAFRSPFIRAIWVLYPALVVYSIVATGNHWVLDAIAGAFAALLAFTLSLAISRGVLPRLGRAPTGPLTPRGPALAGKR